MWKYFILLVFLSFSFNGYTQKNTVPEGFELVSLDGKDAYLNLETGEIKLINAKGKAVVISESQGVDNVTNFIVTSPISNKTHIVKKGETLYQIARLYDVTIRDITMNNRFDREIYPGQKIFIASNNTDSVNNTIVNTVYDGIHIVKKGETLYSLSNKYNTSITRLKELNQLNSNTILINQRLRLK